MNNLLVLYKKMLHTIGMVVDDQGFVSTITPGADVSKPMLVGEKRLVLPYPVQMEETDWSNRIGFHPLLQNFTSGDSNVTDAVRNRANRHLDFIIGMTFLNLAQLASKSEVHKDLKPEQARYLRPFASSNEKFVNIVKHIVVAKPMNKKGFEFIRFSVPMGRSWNGQKRHRVAVATFPLYDQLPKDDKNCTIAGQKLSIKETKMMREMYQFLFPHIDEKGYYEYGSDSKFGPTIEALYHLFALIFTEHNKHIATLEGAMVGTDFLYIPTDWREELENIPALVDDIRSIPPLDDNSTKARVIKDKTIPVNPPTAHTPVAQVGKKTSVPVINSQEIMEQAQQQQVKQGFVRVGDDVSGVAATRTVASVTTTDKPMQVDVSAYKPTPMVRGFVDNRIQQQQQQQPQQQFIRNNNQQQNGLTVTDIPPGSRFVNGHLYIRLEGKGDVVQMPPNSLMLDGDVYIPHNVQPGNNQHLQQQQVRQQGNFQQPIQNNGAIDPSQINGLSEAEIQMYRNNPAMFQIFLQNMQQTNVQQYAQQQAQRNTAAPYLQRLSSRIQEVNHANRFGLR